MKVDDLEKRVGELRDLLESHLDTNADTLKSGGTLSAIDRRIDFCIAEADAALYKLQATIARNKHKVDRAIEEAE